MRVARLPLLLLLLVGATYPWRAPARAATSSAPAEGGQPALVLYNDHHFHLVGLGGTWRVSSAPSGSRLRPAQDFGTVQLIDLRTGEVLERVIPSGGELALAFGWIAVNTADQNTF